MRVLVLGLGVSGTAAAELLSAQGHDVVGYDVDPQVAEGSSVEDVRSGPWEAPFLDGIELVVPSPGIPESAAPVRDALEVGLTVWSELELGFRSTDARVLAITGTNGKTTVTELAAQMLVESGVDAVAVGNIGAPISAAGDHDVLVVEASSFQLRFIDTFRADAAVIINFSPDHLDWHRDVAAYGAAKARIFENGSAGTPLVYDADDAGAAGLVAGAEAALIGVSGVNAVGSSGRVGDDLVLVDTVIPLGDLPRSDAAMLVDLAAAAEAAVAVGATSDGIERAARSYRSGRHRREVVAEVGGVTYVDDSKATNPHAALAAIASYPSVVLIAGGRAKGLDIQPLARADSVRRVVAIGESADQLVDARPDSVVADTMAEAVDTAVRISSPGDVVLLAPGCASFDMFDSYGHRGDVFAAAVRERVGA